MFRFPPATRPPVALFSLCLLAACSATPPERINEDGQRVQRVCEEREGSTGSRLGNTVCRDVVVGPAPDAEPESAEESPND